jgi:hypothetical protein
MPSDSEIFQGLTNTEFIGDRVDGRGLGGMIRLGSVFFSLLSLL